MKKALVFIVTILTGATMLLSPILLQRSAYAGETPCTCSNGKPGKAVDAAILKGVCECGGGESTKEVLKLVVDIMSVLIGILGVIGITITGVQYLTAGGSEEKTRKAKRRMLEIVIGLAAYAVLYALLTWLLPGFDPSNI